MDGENHAKTLLKMDDFLGVLTHHFKETSNIQIKALRISAWPWPAITRPFQSKDPRVPPVTEDTTVVGRT